MHGRLWARIAAGLWAVGIVVGTLGRASHVGQHLRTTGAGHIVAHVGVFAVLGALTAYGFGSSRYGRIALVVAVLLGTCAEVYESVAFHGAMEYADVATNVCGLLLGLGFAYWMERRRASSRT